MHSALSHFVRYSIYCLLIEDSCAIRTAVSLEMQRWWGKIAEPQSCVTSQAEELPRAAQSSLPFAFGVQSQK